MDSSEAIKDRIAFSDDKLRKTRLFTDDFFVLFVSHMFRTYDKAFRATIAVCNIPSVC